MSRVVCPHAVVRQQARRDRARTVRPSAIFACNSHWGRTMVREIQHLIGQMDETERRTYLAESLFLNTVKYENDKLEAYMRKLTKT